MSHEQLYVYYKLRREDAAVAREAFESARGLLDVRLLQRRDEGELLTWMEIYEADCAAQEPAIASALQRFVQGGRHVEAFMPVSG